MRRRETARREWQQCFEGAQSCIILRFHPSMLAEIGLVDGVAG